MQSMMIGVDLAKNVFQIHVATRAGDPRVTSALIGASRSEQIEDSIKALANLRFSQQELSEIDKCAVHSDINLWAKLAEP